MIRRLFSALAAVAGSVMLSMTGALGQEPIVADHTCTDQSKVPACWIEQAKAQFRLSYGHTSHGSQIISGLNVIKYPAGSLYWWDHDGTSGGLSLHDYTPSGDLGNPDRTTWATRTRDMLEASGNDRNVVMWSWCGQADTTPENMQVYLDLMSDLEADYTDVTFVYMTGHLNGGGETGDLHLRNNQIRDHCIANNAVLFDFADIESYDPDGNEYLSLDADDNCDYWDGGIERNWADQWCAANPASELCATCSCAHSKALNCNLKARAFWWMMARLAGWDGTDHADFDQDCDVDTDDYNAFGLCFTGPGGGVGTGCEPGDLDDDNDVDCTDWDLFVTAWTEPGSPPELPTCAPAPSVPTVSNWGVIATFILLVALGSILARRRSQPSPA